MLLTYLGNTADINQVTPNLSDFSLADEWRPTDKIYVNASIRFENDQYDLANTDTPDKNFWFAAAQKEFCINPVTRQPFFVLQPPQSIRSPSAYVAFNCPIDTSTGDADPDGASRRDRRHPSHQQLSVDVLAIVLPSRASRRRIRSIRTR